MEINAAIIAVNGFSGSFFLTSLAMEKPCRHKKLCDVLCPGLPLELPSFNHESLILSKGTEGNVVSVCMKQMSSRFLYPEWIWKKQFYRV